MFQSALRGLPRACVRDTARSRCRRLHRHSSTNEPISIRRATIARSNMQHYRVLVSMQALMEVSRHRWSHRPQERDRGRATGSALSRLHARHDLDAGACLRVEPAHPKVRLDCRGKLSVHDEVPQSVMPTSAPSRPLISLRGDVEPQPRPLLLLEPAHAPIPSSSLAI